MKKLLIPIAVVAILLLGAYLRLYRISEYMTFLGDEGRDVLIVKRMLVDHKFTLLGPTASVGGFFLGPIYYYFMLPFLWLWRLDPTGPAVMVALFGVVTIYLVFRVGRDFFSESVGLIAASLYAVSPLVIAYSRSSWNPNLVPFFSLILVYFLWRVVACDKPKDLFWIGLSLGIGLQLHYLFIFLFGVVIFWFFIYGRKRRYLPYYGLGLLGLMLGFSPFLAFEIRKGFPNTVSIIKFLLAGKETGFNASIFLANLTNIPFRLFGRLVLRIPEGQVWNNYPRWQINMWIAGTCFSLYLSLGLLAHYLLKGRKLFQGFRAGIILLIIWFMVILGLFAFYKRAIYDYYFGIFWALPFLLVALSLWQLSQFKFGKLVMMPIWLGLLYLNWQGRPFLYSSNNQLGQVKRIAQAVFEKAEGKPFNFALVTDGNSDHAYRYFFEIWGNPPITIENELKDSLRRTVTDQLIVLCENPSCQPLGHPLWEIAGFGQAEIIGSWDVPYVRIYKLIHYQGEKK